MDVFFDSVFVQHLNNDMMDVQILRRKGMRRLLDIFDDYNRINVYSNLNEDEIMSNYIFQKLSNINAIHDSEEVFRVKLKSSSISPQTIAFISEDYDRMFVNQIKSLGGLCFNEKNYLDEIERFLSYEKPIYLKYGDTSSFSWAQLQHYGFENSFSLIIDKYLLSSESKTKEYFLPLLKGLNIENQTKCITIISSSETGVIDKKTKDIISEFCTKNNIPKEFLEIISFDSKSPFNFHDRYLFSRYVAIDSGRGFDNIFKKHSKRSDAKLKIRTIFTYETYNDFMNLIPAYQEYVKWHNLNKNTNYKVPFK
jgi:hypothetical protein